jgi:hypothetical protein
LQDAPPLHNRVLALAAIALVFLALIGATIALIVYAASRPPHNTEGSATEPELTTPAPTAIPTPVSRLGDHQAYGPPGLPEATPTQEAEPAR